jgi:prepilin-type N-terminal cleavage/methylation domain-containing protein
MVHRLIKRHKGFTLLEILLTLLLFSAGIVAIAGLFGTSLDSSLDTENTEIAVNLAQRRMEEICNKTYDSITVPVYEAKAQINSFPLFQRSVTVTESPADLKQVTVTVFWNFKNKEVSVPLVSYVSKN